MREGGGGGVPTRKTGERPSRNCIMQPMGQPILIMYNIFRIAWPGSTNNLVAQYKNIAGQ